MEHYNDIYLEDVDLFLTDDRYFRSEDEMPDSINGLPNKDKEFFGKQQMEWLKNALLFSHATFKIIVTGSNPQKTLLIYGIAADAAPVNQGNINPAVFDTTVVGTDVFMYVSGGLNERQDGNGSISVFGGDVVIQAAQNTIAIAIAAHQEGIPCRV